MPSTKPLVVVLLGPTASGKTDLAIELAEKLDVSLHNIDSRQLYIGMDIGTAKPTEEQQKRVQHFLINLRHPNQPINLSEFQEIAKPSLDRVISKEGMGFLVGGSGLYLKSLVQGLQPPKVPPQKSPLFTDY